MKIKSSILLSLAIGITLGLYSTIGVKDIANKNDDKIVYASGGTTPPPPPPKTNVESCGSGTYNWTDGPYRTGSNVYQTPTVTYISDPTYERSLTNSDFSSNQNYTYPQKERNVTTTYYYVNASDTDTTSYYCNKSDVNNYGGWYPTTGYGSESPPITVTQVSDTRTTNGLLTFRATATGNGKTSAPVTASSYWVTSVSFSSSDSDGRSISPDYVSSPPSIKCWQTMANNATQACNAQGYSTTGTGTLLSTMVATENSAYPSGGMNSKIQSLINDSNTETRKNWMSVVGRQSTSNMTTVKNEVSYKNLSSTSSTSTSDGANLNVYDTTYYRVFMYTYKDPYTNKEGSYVYRVWKLATVDVEDETRSPFYKEVPNDISLRPRLTSNYVFSSDPNVTRNYTCEVIYYGPDQTRDCHNSVTIQDRTSSVTGTAFQEGTNEVRAIERTTASYTKGDPYRYVSYTYQITDSIAGRTRNDTDGRVIQYVFPKNQSKTGTDGVIVTQVAQPTLKVLETHDRGVAKEQTYTRFGEPTVTWKGVAETYEHNNRPTCVKNFAASLFNSTKGQTAQSVDCTSSMQISYNGKDTNANLNGGTTTSTNTSYNYTLGPSQRIERHAFVENGYLDYKDLTYLYVTNIDIGITGTKTYNGSTLTYQDELFPKYTCTKTYTNGTLSCLDKMYAYGDTGQNSTPGASNMRKITYRYVNNFPQTSSTVVSGKYIVPTVSNPTAGTYVDENSEYRAYATKVDITSSNPTSGKTGTRTKFTGRVTWQDGTVKEITILPNTWTSKVKNTGEAANFIGDYWVNGYVDRKGERHKPTAINELYITDPVSKDYIITATYPNSKSSNPYDGGNTSIPYENGLTAKYGLVEDKYAPKIAEAPFKLIGIKSIKIVDETDTVHQIDKDSNGNTLTSKFGDLEAKLFSGLSSNKPLTAFAFNNKTYQTGHWYDFKAVVEWDDGTKTEIRDNSSFPEATWSYKGDPDADGNNGFVTKTTKQNFVISGASTTNTVNAYDKQPVVAGGNYSTDAAKMERYTSTNPQPVNEIYKDGTDGFYGSIPRTASDVVKDWSYKVAETFYDTFTKKESVYLDVDSTTKATFSGTLTKEEYPLQKLPEAWKIDNKGYQVSGYNTSVPKSGSDHRLPIEGWNSIRFDLFSESSMPKPAAQNNALKSQTYEEASMWAHSPLELVIDWDGTASYGVPESFKSFLIWNDGSAKNQKGVLVGSNNNPWGTKHSERTEVSASAYSGWNSPDQPNGGNIAPASPVSITFNEYKGNNNYRTVTTWWGDKDKGKSDLSGFSYWDYFFQEIEVFIGDNSKNNSTSGQCQNIISPKKDCQLPIDGTNGVKNPNMPANANVSKDREIEYEFKFNVTGVSKGTGQ